MEDVASSEIRVVGLGCRRDNGDWIFKNLNFSVKPGEALAITGPSGSGKTTLAYCLVGIIPNKIKAEVEGRILADGRDILSSSLRENVKTINIILQNYEMQIFGLTVEEDIIFSLENLGLKEEEVECRLEEILKNFGLEKYRSYYVHELSGGLRQRLAIASSIAMAPKYLVMDDPTANLDWKGIIELRKTIRKLKEEGRGIVVMTRRLKGLEKAVDKVIKLGERNRKTGIRSIKAVRRLSENPETLIRFENVWFKYSREYVLRGISLEIASGESVALMGPNGSGKTTLAKHINSLLKPSRGRVLVAGKDTREFSPAQLAGQVAFVFQDPDKHITGETVWEEVTFGARNLGLPYTYAEEALKTLGLEDRRDDPPYFLSMGEKIRVSIAGALAMNPKILVLDEPTTGQDNETLETIASVIVELKSQGRTVIVVTHDSDFALKVSDRVIALKNGEIAVDGLPSEILLNEPLVKTLELEPPSQLLEKAEVII